MIVRRGKAYHLKIKPFGHPIWVRTLADTKQEAREIERAVLTALRVADFRSLWPEAREVALRIYENQRWTVPDDLRPKAKPTQELTLWDAAKLFFEYPSVAHCKTRERYTYALGHVIEAWGRDRPVKSIKVADVREYQASRLQSGASPATVDRERGALSRLFQVLIELEHVQVNPVQAIKSLSLNTASRQVYLSLSDVQRIADVSPDWYRPMLWTAFFTGMRRGEILDLTRNRLNLSKRLIYMGPENTKEGRWKRVPIHRELVPILEAVLQGPALIGGKVFSFRDADGIKELGLETFKNVWPRACEALGLEKPHPRFHDLRHTWKTNARRSKMHPEIEKTIMGHSEGAKSVHERYGHINDDELIEAIDNTTFNHGDSVILVAKTALGVTPGRGSTKVAKSSPKKKGQGVT